MKTQWQTYQELELIPNSIQAPQVSKMALLSWLDNVWRALLGNQIENYTHEEQVNHLTHCLELEYAQTTAHPGFWRRFWNVLNQPLDVRAWSSIESEPQIKKIFDQEGHTWWQAYDPITRQTTYLESEEEVLIWLEERLHF